MTQSSHQSKGIPLHPRDGKSNYFNSKGKHQNLYDYCHSQMVRQRLYDYHTTSQQELFEKLCGVYTALHLYGFDIMDELPEPLRKAVVDNEIELFANGLDFSLPDRLMNWRKPEEDIEHLLDATVLIAHKSLVKEPSSPMPQITNPQKPTVVCLCGSTRFKSEFEQANKQETLKGNIVLSVGFFGHCEDEPLSVETKKALDQLHLAKIAMADEVLILNVGGYIGSSTKNELHFALSAGKHIRFLEPDNVPQHCLGLPIQPIQQP